MNEATESSSMGTETPSKNPPSPSKSASKRAPMLGELPPNWKESFDAARNRTYYFNPTTKESSWVHPSKGTSTSSLNGRSSKRSLASKTSSTVGGDGEWVEKFDTVHQRKFWYNKKLKQSSWTKPAALAAAATSATSSETASSAPTSNPESLVAATDAAETAPKIPQDDSAAASPAASPETVLEETTCPFSLENQTTHVKSLGPHPKYPARFAVPEDLVSWLSPFPAYAPVEHTDPVVLANDVTVNPKGWADPADVSKIEEELSKRRSYAGVQDLDASDHPLWFPDPASKRPRNNVGRTGMSGRGLLGKWGPNYAADPLVTRGNSLAEMEMVVIKRGDTGEWAIPGGMVDAGEAVSLTLQREFREECQNMEDQDVAQDVKARLDALFESGGQLVMRGYVDDPRNTDNAWMETTCVHFHITDPVLAEGLQLAAGDDATHARWLRVQDVLSGEEKLYASHRVLVEEAVRKYEFPLPTIQEESNPFDDVEEPQLPKPANSDPSLPYVGGNNEDVNVSASSSAPPVLPGETEPPAAETPELDAAAQEEAESAAAQVGGAHGNIFSSNQQSRPEIRKYDLGEGDQFQNEVDFYTAAKGDPIAEFLPEFLGVFDAEPSDPRGKRYLLLSDARSLVLDPGTLMSSAAVMDVKLGQRSYTAAAPNEPKSSYYEKYATFVETLEEGSATRAWSSLNPERPEGPESLKDGLLGKRDYLAFRDATTTSTQHGFRLTAFRGVDGEDELTQSESRSVETLQDFHQALERFVSGGNKLAAKLAGGLLRLHQAAVQSPLIAKTDIVGSSLLLVHDGLNNVAVRWIDFSNTSPITEDSPIPRNNVFMGITKLKSSLESVSGTKSGLRGPHHALRARNAPASISFNTDREKRSTMKQKLQSMQHSSAEDIKFAAKRRSSASGQLGDPTRASSGSSRSIGVLSGSSGEGSQQLTSLLTAQGVKEPTSPVPRVGALLRSPVGREGKRHGAYSSMLQPSSDANKLPVILTSRTSFSSIQKRRRAAAKLLEGTDAMFGETAAPAPLSVDEEELEPEEEEDDSEEEEEDVRAHDAGDEEENTEDSGAAEESHAPATEPPSNARQATFARQTSSEELQQRIDRLKARGRSSFEVVDALAANSASVAAPNAEPEEPRANPIDNSAALSRPVMPRGRRRPASTVSRDGEYLS